MNGKRFKKLLALGTAVCTFGASSLCVSAAGLQDIFDADYYADRYADMEATYGDDADALYQHFLTYGLEEGRNMSPILDVVAYREAYADLDAAFGDDWDAYVEHFLTYGMYEGRTEGVLMNPLDYEAAYADLQAAFGDDYLAVIQHYLTYGISEGRTAGTSHGYDSISDYQEALAAAAAAASNSSSSSGTTETPSSDSSATTVSDSDATNVRMPNMDTRTLSYTSYSTDGTMTSYGSSETYESGGISAFNSYNADGTLTSSTTYYENGNTASSNYNYYDENGTLSYSYACTYNENGDIIGYQHYDENGDLQSSEVYTYDENGNLLTREYQYSDGQTGCITYTYDEDGRLIQWGGNYIPAALGEMINFTSEYIYEDNGYWYVDNGRKSVYYEEDADGTVRSYGYSTDGTLTSSSTTYENGNYSYVTYNEDGTETVTNSYSSEYTEINGGLYISSSTSVSTDYSTGPIITADTTSTTTTTRKEYIYDESGTLTRINTYTDGELTSYTVNEGDIDWTVGAVSEVTTKYYGSDDTLSSYSVSQEQVYEVTETE